MRIVERTIQILETLAESPNGLGVVDLSRRLGEPAPTVHRLLVVLVRHGLVAQEATSKRYRLGRGVLGFAGAYQDSNNLVQIARPYLERVRTATFETTFLTEFDGDDVVCVDMVESPRPLRFFVRVGQRMPFRVAASARAILAFQPAQTIQALLTREPSSRYTESGPTSLAESLAALESVRARGYAVCEQEMEPHVVALAFPIRNAVGDVAASVGLVAPDSRFRDEERKLAAAVLDDAASAISLELGYREQTAKISSIARG